MLNSKGGNIENFKSGIGKKNWAPEFLETPSMGARSFNFRKNLGDVLCN